MSASGARTTAVPNLPAEQHAIVTGGLWSLSGPGRGRRVAALFYKIRVLVSGRVQAGLRAPSFRSSFRSSLLNLGAQSSAPSPPAPAPALRPPTRADLLRGEYGRYRANNDLLSYRLDIRVDPDRKFLSGTNTIRFRMLADDNRIQLDLYDNLAIDEIRLGATVLEYERELNSFFVKFPSTLKAGKTYAIDVRYSGAPREQGRFGGIAFRQRPRRPALDQHGVRGRRGQHLVAEQGPVARRSRGDGTARGGPERSGRRLERQVRRARPISATATPDGTGTSSTRSTTTTSR